MIEVGAQALELVAAAGKDQAPCLVAGGAAHHESADIIKHWAEAYAPL